MDLFGNLMQLGAANGGGGPPAAPTSMSQIKVQPQAMDLSSTIPAANSQLSYDKAAQSVAGQTDWGSIGKGILGGVAGSMGGGGKQGGLMQPGRFDGRGQDHERVHASKFSGANLAGTQFA